MSLRIRRGTEAQRTGATFDLGEVAWTTDTNKLYVGDGVNLGGKNILATSAGAGLVWNAATQRLDFNGNGTGIVNVQADANPSLGGNLNLNNRNITGIGNINIIGTINASQFIGNLSLTGQLTATSGNSAHTMSSSSSIPLQINALFGGNTPLIALNTSNGTILTPTNLVPGDFVGGLKLGAYYNGVSKFAGGIVSRLDADADMTKVFPKSTLYILTGNNSDSLQAVAAFQGSGAFAVPILQVLDVAGSLPTPAAAGMIVLDGTTFKGYNGTAWVTLG